MLPTKTHGICAMCCELNAYTSTHCHHCGARLLWAFLIDGMDEDKKEPSPFRKFMERFFHIPQQNASKVLSKHNIPKHKVRCRFCDHFILENRKICPHCRRWQAASTFPTGRLINSELVDADAPEIKRLVKEYKYHTPNI